LSGFSEALAKELSPYGVKVTCICPSMVATEITADWSFKREQRMETADINKTISYLLSLSKNALPLEIAIHCLPFIEKTTQVTNKIFGVTDEKK
jgi:short-subunit dehydrogenase